ncbi:MAG TPA: ATP-binding protein [Actinomycetota bacterium]|nr:ATP-binding protein [Actinomycetota bacterium]
MASDRPQDRDRAVTIPARAGRVAPLVARMAIRRPLRRWGGYALAVGGTVILTAVLLPFRSSLAELTEAFGYLGVVVAAAAVGGVGPGMASSVLAFLVFNFFFLPPYDSFAIGRAQDIVVLFVFLAFSVLISATLARARERASAAEAREAELAGLQELSAQLVATGPAAGGYAPVLARVAALFGYTSATLATGPTPAGGVALLVAGQQVGRLLFDGSRPSLTDSERRVLRAFADQFALAVERDRLAQAALESEVYRETDQIRRSLLAAVSHDLRSPLAAIKASVTDLLDADADHAPDDVRDALESVNSETDRLDSMVANLLDMSRIEGGTLHARIQDVDLEEVLGECTERIHRRWPALDLSVAVDEDAAVVRADPVFLDRVVANLLENAAKAARGHGLGVAAGARRDDGRVIVSVIDHGEGVPEAMRSQLFYPFYRGTERPPGTGTGLGLAICKGFLALMAGEIWVDETPGGGATFRFSVPAAPQLPPSEATEPPEAAEPSEAEPSEAEP